jgi:AcrR family transcriptional regulator
VAEAAAPSIVTRRLPRKQRREQIVSAATRAFAKNGFAATNLDDIAAEAGISRVILYRHFDSKTGLYQAVLDNACQRLIAATGADQFAEHSIARLLAAAAEDPAGFRLLFHHAAHEPEFRRAMDQFHTDMTAAAHKHLVAEIPDPAWAAWAAALVPTVAIAAVTAWLDTGQPDPDHAANRVRDAIYGVISAAQRPTRALSSPGD